MYVSFEILCSKLVIFFSIIAQCFEKTYQFFFISQKAFFAKIKTYDIVRRALIPFELRILVIILLILKRATKAPDANPIFKIRGSC